MHILIGLLVIMFYNIFLPSEESIFLMNFMAMYMGVVLIPVLFGVIYDNTEEGKAETKRLNRMRQEGYSFDYDPWD